MITALAKCPRHLAEKKNILATPINSTMKSL